MTTFPYRAPALRVVQPLGIYYVAVIPASVLLQTCFSDKLRAVPRLGGVGYELEGTQRKLAEPRLKDIADYIDRTDAGFPNSIILAANFRERDATIEEEQSLRWSAAKEGDGDRFVLTIPTGEKICAVIDGQHRLFAFNYAAASRLEEPLICSVFIDLPRPVQAQIFATINSNQKPVSKSQTYELFGYEIEDEDPKLWSPDKLAVLLTRRLNAEEDSPLAGRILIAAESEFDQEQPAGWRVSLATIVEGIVRLISSNPKIDTNELKTPPPKTRAALQSARKDGSPWRSLYTGSQDLIIYTAVKNYLAAVDELFWRPAPPGSFITKTIGIQALFDVLRVLAPTVLKDENASREWFLERLAGAKDLDFAAVEFQSASGSGRVKIRKAILEAMGLAPVPPAQEP